MPRTAREVLNELRWRRGFDLAHATLWVADRTSPGGGRALSGADVVELRHRYLVTARATIPFYKVLRIEYEGRVLFERNDVPQDS